jgi:hypothetical protein
MCLSVRACVWKFVWLCVVLYILSHLSCYFTIGVCQLEHVYESLYDCVSCPVYIVVRLMLFHYMCVSVRACVWKFVWLCVVLYILSYLLCYSIIGVCQWEHLYESLYDCCLVLYILLYVLCYFIICVCQWEHVYESLYDCVSCPVYIVVRLVLFHYRCVSGRACVWTFVWLCVVLYILSYVLCYFTIGVCQLEHVYESLYDCVLSCIYCRTSYVIKL